MTNRTFETLAAVILVVGTAAAANAQSFFEQAGNAVNHAVNEVDKAVRDIAPVQVDLRQGGRVIVNGPTHSVAIDPGTGRTITTQSPSSRFVESLSGQPMCQAVMAAKGSIRTRYPLPAEVAQDLIAVGVPANIVRKTTWSPDWYATNYMPGTGGQGAVTLDDVVIISDNRLVYDRAFMAHELKHVQQYERLGLNNFCAQYTTNSWIFENEAKDEQTRVARAIAQLQADRQGGNVGGPQNNNFAYFNLNGAYYYGDAAFMLYPADPRSGQVIGPAVARVAMQSGQFWAVDGYGRSYPMQRVR